MEKKVNYQAPEVQVVELEMAGTILAPSTGGGVTIDPDNPTEEWD